MALETKESSVSLKLSEIITDSKDLLSDIEK